MMDVNQITGRIVNTAYRVHTDVGPGLLEGFYESVLLHSLKKQGLYVEKQKVIAIEWDGIRIEEAYRVDLLVERQVVVELKSLKKLHPVHHKQVLTYLRLLDLPVGLLLNFGEVSLKNGVHRILNPHATVPPPVLDPRLRTLAPS